MTDRFHQRAVIAPACLAILAFSGLAGCADSGPAEAALGVDIESSDIERKRAACEVPIGAFRLSVPVDLGEYEAWYRVTFDLAVGVSESDEDEFTEFVAKHDQRLRLSVASVLRQAGIDNLDNAKLSELRLQVSTAINRLIGRTVVKVVYLADFRVEVQ